MNEVGASSASEVSSLVAPELSSSLVPSSMPTAPSEDSCYKFISSRKLGMDTIKS